LGARDHWFESSRPDHLSLPYPINPSYWYRGAGDEAKHLVRSKSIETQIDKADSDDRAGAMESEAPRLNVNGPSLRQAMGFRDLVLFYVASGFSLRWIATAAAAGPSAIIIWIIACLSFFLPLVACVLELSSRYPQEGGIYVWSKKAFGGFAGFMTGWTYWASNLPYFPALLYFAAANALYLGGGRWQRLSANPTYFIVFALTGLALAVSLNIIGLEKGKWLPNLGSLGLWIPAMVIVIMGGIAWYRFGPANEFSAHALVPSVSLKDIIFWSTIAFAFGGVESASTMAEEIKDSRRILPKALVTAGVLITVIYILGTAGLLLSVPRKDIDALQGVMQAIGGVGDRLGVTGLSGITAALIVVGSMGGVGAWFAATARLPFVAGVDRLLPAAFGKLHFKWRTPYVALLVQAGIAAVFIFLGQAGTNVKGAYDVLVSMSIIAYFIPFLYMFCSVIALQREEPRPGVIRLPGGKPVSISLAILGLTTTSISIVLAVIPAEDEPNKRLAVIKVVGSSVVLVAVGAVVYLIGRLRFRKGERTSHGMPLTK
jgi:amino acid transporter